MAKRKETWRDVLAEKPDKPTDTLDSLPTELRGPTQNKYGGYRTRRLRAFPGSKFGPASPVRRPSAEEMSAIIDDLKKRGLID